MLESKVESNSSLSLQQLQQISYDQIAPFQLHFNEQSIQCDQLLRVVPGKRLVFRGQYAEQNVIIKLFVHASRAEKHWTRERAGAKLLQQHAILTPEIMVSGVAKESVYFLIFPFIDGEDLSSFWQQNSAAQRQQKLSKMMPVLAQHHQAGLAHQDLHYANFLLDKNDNVLTLDGEEVSSTTAPLNKTARLKNLALFLAQTFDVDKASCIKLLADYAQVSGIDLKPEDNKIFWQWIKGFHQERIRHYLKKILRECTEIIYNKTSLGYTLCRREYHNPDVQKLLEQPESFFQDEQSVSLKQGNTCTVKSVRVGNESYVIKRYNPKGVFYELTHKGKNSRARTSWINAHLLRFMGILTPEPVALIEQRAALGKRCSYFISRHIEGKNSWDFFCDQSITDDIKRRVADKLYATFRLLGEHFITHGDTKGSNFLIDNEQIWILDLDGLVQHKKPRTFNKAWKKDKARFLKNWDKKTCYETCKQYFEKIFGNDNTSKPGEING